MAPSSWDKLKIYGVEKVYGGEGAPSHEEYADKLADPRWRAFTDLVKRKRGPSCAVCGSLTHLQVHHLRYLPGLEPWEHPMSEVKLLCVDCHATVHRINPTQVVVKGGGINCATSQSRPSVEKNYETLPLNSAAFRKRIGRWVMFDGTVDEVRICSNGNTYISLSGKYPNAIITLVIFPADISEFKNLNGCVGKKIRVNGRIQEYKSALQVVANTTRQIEWT